MIASKDRIILLLLLVTAPIASLVHLTSGTIYVDLATFFEAVFDFEADNSQHILAREFRIPRTAMAIFSGSALAVCGMLMQTLFRNPLAGPYILGINSGASLAVATGILSGFSFFSFELSTVFLAFIGALLSGLLILGVSGFVRNNVSLLLVGIMIGSFTSALTSVVQTISTAESVKGFMMWGMGSLQLTEFHHLPLIGTLFLFGMLLSLISIRPLNALVLGDEAATTLGIRIKWVRLILIVITALLAGLITAFCGPIAFVGMAIPNLCRILFNSQDHFKLFWANLLCGALFMLICDLISISLEQYVLLPINAITSILGAPFIIYIIIRRMA